MSDGMAGSTLFGWIGNSPDMIGRGVSDDFAAAVFNMNRAEETEAIFDIPSETHLVCTTIAGSMDWDLQVPGRRVVRPCERNSVDMGFSGERAHVRYGNARAAFVHFYVPERWFTAHAHELAPSVGQGTVELIDPQNARCDVVGDCGRRVVEVLRQGGPTCRLEIEAIGLGLAASLLRLHSNVSPRLPAQGGLSGGQLTRLNRYLADHVAEDVTLAELASIVNLSPYHFCRAFKRATGLPPHRYQLMLRIERAKDVLANTPLSIADVAASVGYDDASQLARLFRREVGVTPSQFRRERNR